MTALEQYAEKNPNRRVRLLFRSEDGKTGMLETTVAHAINPNASQRFFPPDGETPATLGWGMPHWYAEECYKAILL